MHLSPGSRVSSHTPLWQKIERTAAARYPVMLHRNSPVDKIRRIFKIEAICDAIAAKRIRFVEIRLIRVQKQVEALEWAAAHPPKPPKLEPSRRWTAREIICLTAHEHGLLVNDLLCASRTHVLILARHEACYEMARLTPLSLTHIGRLLGGRDHTTIINAIRRHIERTGAPSVRGLHPEHAKST